MFDDDEDGLTEIEKRRSRRRRTLKRGYIVSEGTDLRYKCKIADINEHGARLEMAIGVPPPDQFTLRIEVERQEVDCKVARRTGRSVAVEFVSLFRYAAEDVHVSLFPQTAVSASIPPGRRLLRRSRPIGDE